MLACIIFFCSFIAAATSQSFQSSKPLQDTSCDSLCTCTEKDGVLYLNCEERNISKISQVKVPPALPFHLNLYKNDIVELLAEDLKDLKNAVSLHLGANSIQELEPGVFSGFSSLKKLHINSNFLVMLKEDTFQGLVNLEYLQADTNFIRVIEPGTFSKLVRLKVLILNDNAIEFLPSNIFRFVPLTHLDLRGNQLQSLPYVGFLEHIGRIMELLLDDNDWVCECEIIPLKIWMENMRALSTISEVVCVSPPHLKGSLLSKVKKEVLCPASRDLEDPSKPSVLEVTPTPRVIQNPKLMDDGKIPTPGHPPGKFCIERCSCHNHPIAGFLVHCQDRGIQRISDLGLLLQSPTKLVLTGNMIQKLLQYDFVAYESLELLNLANNQIDYIDNETFLSLGHLKKLYLNGNRLDHLSSSMFVGLHNLEYLYLEYNVIKDILPGTFDTVPNLKLLSLNNNLLKTLPPQIFRNVPLTKLNLRKNLFMHLPVSSVLDQLDSVEQIYLEDNPWDCSCDLVGLKQWVEQLGKDAVVGNILCHSPRKIAKMDLRSLGHETMCPGLGTYSFMPTKENDGSVTTTATTTSIFRPLFDTIPLSVLILSLLIIFLMIVFCAAGIIVLVLHRRRKSKKKEMEDQPRESSPIHLQYSMYGQKTTHHLSSSPRINMYEEPTNSPIIQVCRNASYCTHHKEHELEEQDANEGRGICMGLPEKENDSPLTGRPSMKYRPVTEYPSEFVTLGDTNCLYRNIIEREKELQQLGITEYLRKNISQLQPALDVPSQGRHEELKLMETIMYSRPRKVVVEQTKNEYFELKANLQAEPDYLEVLEHQSTFN
ncbi:SLIT and NTRK-like protein 6 [Scleropages formosus]|nr:SLIT and NTRK-like protein 6 [Scleropages formosus]XP_018597176.1 SLIT and NTRK-like protein 6 [Scleropages formosus]XP_018597185.1 SLIT and NTRK-like protein 6 [Scleropages formosus]XP_029112933.1 SLIT and NTRK-like protein 6 [Scleropages formosus]